MLRTVVARSPRLLSIHREARRGILTKAFRQGPTEVRESSDPELAASELGQQLTPAASTPRTDGT